MCLLHLLVGVLTLQAAARPIIEPVMVASPLPFTESNESHRRGSAPNSSWRRDLVSPVVPERIMKVCPLPSTGFDKSHRCVSTPARLRLRDPVGPVVAPTPAGLGPAEMTLWNGMSQRHLYVQGTDEFILYTGPTAWEKLHSFQHHLMDQNPDVEIRSVFDTYEWDTVLEAYRNSPDKLVTRGDYMEDATWSIKYAEALANHPGPVHIFYKKSDGINVPDNSYLKNVELGVITAPGSKVSQIYRWETSNYKAASPKEIWKNGDPQLSKLNTDLSINPRDADMVKVQNGPDFPRPNQAKQTLDNALSNVLTKAQQNGVTSADVQATFTAFEDVIWSALKTIERRGVISQTAQTAVAGLSPVGSIDDPIANRLKWKLEGSKEGLDEEILSQGYKPDGEGNLCQNIVVEDA